MTKKITQPCGDADEEGPSRHTRSKSNGKTTNPTPKDSLHFSSDQKDEIRRMITEEIAKAMPAIIAAVRNASNSSKKSKTYGLHKHGDEDKISDNEGSNMNNNQYKVVDQEKKKKCHYKDFLACQPNTFNGENGAIEAYNWLEKMEALLHISDCDEKDKVMFAAQSFESEALFWWGLILRTRGRDVVHEMSWKEFKELVMEKFCPYSELRKIEFDFMHLEMTGLDYRNYTLKFNELSRLVPHLVTPETKRVSRYIEGLAPEVRKFMFNGNQMTFQSVVNLARKLTENQMERQRNDNTSSKRKWDESKGKGIRDNNSGCKICGKMHSDRCWFEGTTCGKCSKKGHTTFNCPGNEVICYDCGEPGHYHFNCLNRKPSQ